MAIYIIVDINIVIHLRQEYHEHYLDKCRCFGVIQNPMSKFLTFIIRAGSQVLFYFNTLQC